jgi:multidrug efflux pump subunit AcrB/outer membrane protein TolC
MKRLIAYFFEQHFLVNLLTVLVLLGGVLAWNATNKEELPDITFNFVRISTAYSGASAEDIEFYITKPIEEAVRGIDGIRRVTSISSPGNSNVSIELDRYVTNIDKKLIEIQGQLSGISFPVDDQVIPRVRVFETSKKAIIDIAIYNNNAPLLTVKDRMELQQLARGLETKLLVEPELFEVNKQGYLKEKISINVDPKKFEKYDVSLTAIAQEIQRNHVRAPSGTLKSGQFEQVTVVSQLDTKPKLESLIIQGGFDSQSVTLGSVATVTDGFEEQPRIFKVNGREAILFNVVKNSRYGILESLEVVKRVVSEFQATHLKNTPIKLTFLDDESIDVRNRLRIISSNGVLGFFLILGTLFLFLNTRSGVWVALGIPFTLSLTLILGHLMGFTINGITLAGIIIVLGIVVDDAIIVAENITRRRNLGDSIREASVKGTQEVVPPIFASVLTTCAAFIPLYFFSGRFGNFVAFIPPMIFLMLFSSVLESFFFLPAHMALGSKKTNATAQRKWFKRWETTYEKWLLVALKKRYWIVLFFIFLIIFSLNLAKNNFKFVMFPNEESREIVLSGVVDESKSSIDTAKKIQGIEDILIRYVGADGVGVRSNVGNGRRGDAAQENQFSITLELVPKEHRKRSSRQLMRDIEQQVKQIEGISKLKFRKQRFGQASGSVFEIVVSENDDDKRQALVDSLVKALNQIPSMMNVEADIVPMKKEYIVSIDKAELKQLSVNPSSISSTLRIILNGRRLYSLFRNDEEVDVNLTVDNPHRMQMNKVLDIPIENSRNYLIPLRDLVEVKDVMAKKSIRRQDFKRSSFVYADLSPGAAKSPLEVANALEREVFPKLLSNFPLAELSFDGEVVDTRASKRDLWIGILTSIGLIYLVLAILFNSAFKPFRIMLIIPFGVIGVILAFYGHQKFSFGFYAAIGTLGMLGVVVNDAIVMINKLDKTDMQGTPPMIFTASVAKTRLRAIVLTTLTTVAGVMPTAYGIGGTDTMLSDMMIALSWGLLVGTGITLILTPCVFLIEKDIARGWNYIKPKVGWGGLTILVLMSSSVMADSTVISMNEFIIKATKNDTVFHALLMQRLRYQYDQSVNVSMDALAISVASEFSVFPQSGTNYNRISLSQTLPKWGQTLGLTHTDDDTSFVFSQDIAKNAFGSSVRLDHRLQSIKTDIARHQLVEAYEDYLYEIIGLYYTWIRQFETLSLARASFRENEKVFQNILSRQEKKIANHTDVNKLKLQTLAKKEHLIATEKEYVETSFKIRRSLGLSATANIQPNTTIVLDAMPNAINVELQDVQANSRTFKVLALLNTQAALASDRLAQELLPSIRLTGTLIGQSEPLGMMGVSMVFPVTQSKESSTWEVAKINREWREIETLSTSEKLLAMLRSLHNELTAQMELIRLAQRKREVAYAILKAEEDDYSLGKISLNDYIVAVNRYDAARFDEIDRQITFQTLSLQWKKFTDQLVKKSVDNL